MPFLTVIEAPERAAGPVRDRLARAAAPRTFNVGLAAADDWRDYTHVMKLDGDIELQPRYLRELMERFEADPTLGLAGGVLVEPTGRRRLPAHPDPAHHVHGALKSTRASASRRSAASRSASAGTRSTRPTRACAASRLRSFTDLGLDPPPPAGQRRRDAARPRPPRRVRLHRALHAVVGRAARAQGRHAGARGCLSGLAFFYGYVRAAARARRTGPRPRVPALHPPGSCAGGCSARSCHIRRSAQ